MELVNIINELGGEDVIPQKITTSLDLIELIRKGIPKKAMNNLKASLGLTQEEVANIFQLTARTLQRKSDEDLLGTDVSEQLVEVAGLITHGKEVFASLGDFETWLHTPCLALGNEKPVNWLDTHLGIKLVKNELGRIEQGIFA